MGEAGAKPVRLVLVRYQSDGQIDESFGTSSKGNTREYVSDYQGKLLPFETTRLIFGPDGKLTLLGTTPLKARALVLVRYSENGALDLTFGSGGEIILQEPPYGIYYDLVMQPDGSIVVAGELVGDFMLMRLKAEQP